MSNTALDAVLNTAMAGLVGVYFIFVIIIFVFLVCLLIGRIALFRKCGEAGWKAIIPFYSDYVMDVKICGLHWAVYIAEEFLTFNTYTWIIKTLILAMRYYNLGKKFHKDIVPTTIFGALFSSIVEMVYGLGSTYTYDANEKVGNLGFFNKAK